MKARRYRVSGTHPVFRHQPGAVFERAIPPDQEAFLLRCGAITREPSKASRRPRRRAAKPARAPATSTSTPTDAGDNPEE